MSDFNENNNQDNISENQSVEQAEVTNPVPDNDTNENISEISNLNGPEIIGGVETVKKNKTKIIAIIVAVVILIFGCCAGAYAFVPQVKNTVKMLINSPEDYYAWVESENMEESIEFISELIYENDNEKDANAMANIKAELDKEGIEKLISENAGMSLSEAGVTLPSSIDITEKFTVIDGYSATNAEMSVDGNSLLTSNIYFKDNKFYLQYPELSSSYICLDLAEAFKQGFAESGNDQLMESFSAAFDNANSPDDEKKEHLSQDNFEDIFNRYSKVIIDNITNVEMEKNAECEADGIKCEYTKLIVNFDQGTLFSIAKDFLNELKNDDKLLDIVIDNSQYSKEELNSALDEVIKQISGIEMTGGDNYLIMNVFVNSKGEVVGRSFENAENVGGDFSFGYVCTENGNNYGISLFAKVNEEKYSIDGSASESSGKLTGKATVSGNGQKDIFGISFKDLECSGELIKGELTVGLSAFGLDDLTLNFDEKDGSQICSFDLTYEGTKLGSITCESNHEKPDSITVFNNDAKVYDAQNAGEYDNEVDYNEFLKKAAKALFGIELDPNLSNANIFGESFSNLFGDDLDPDYIYDDFDDDFDDDFLMDDDYDDDYDYEDHSVDYDLSKIKIQLDGSDVKLPGKVSGFLDNINFEENEKTDANGYSYGWSDDYHTTVTVYNSTNKEANPKDCDIYGITIYENTKNKLTVDGIGLGDDVQKIVDKYGCNITDQNYSTIQINDTNNYDFISFSYENGKIVRISLYYSSI